VSIEAMMWAMNLAPVPMDESAKKSSPSSSCAFVLIALANHADPEGRDAFPGVATLVRYTRLSERTVRTCLDRLEADGVIRAGDPEVVAAKIKRGDRRPQGWDLAVELIREDLDDDDLLAIAKSNPLLRPFLAEGRPDLGVYSRGATAAPRGSSVNRSTGRGATTAPRDDERGATSANGVQPAQARGAVVAPEPSLNPPSEPTTTTSASSLRSDPEPTQQELIPEANTTPAPKAAKSAAEVELTARAQRGAQLWWDEITTAKGPCVRAGNPFIVLRNQVKAALKAEMTSDQILAALRECGEHVPATWRWEAACARATGHVVDDLQARRGRGAGPGLHRGGISSTDRDNDAFARA
jgi:hypothetical protein